MENVSLSTLKKLPDPGEEAKRKRMSLHVRRPRPRGLRAFKKAFLIY